ncbi:efflux RND transporter permease subunit [Aporhodopirellula aestuarii]|uniref:Efflux RND transporter permease subunit n=1 Tax=Aporhodopirellula aestuarii TaxID=2950107 RepID=A0ABT0U9I0_9BACT|nr:efflux RND transporter permease subunit [Aporhodopirellula aestuarii]MCM2373472.1 efflux RND transporter permease subunit [Aporhodopirellula aestuarii]
MVAAFFNDQRLLVLIVLLILVAGLSSMVALPRMEDPVLAQRVAIIHTRLPGADAKRVETLVTEVIEDRVRDIEEIKEIHSVSRVGISAVSIELRDDTQETENIWSRVRSRLEDSIGELPVEASRPEFRKLEVRAYALIVGLTWDRPEPVDVRVLRRLAIELQDRLQALPGTDLVRRFGDPGEEIEVRVDPARAAAMGITPADLAERLSSYDVKGSAGQLRDQSMQMLIEIDNQFDTVDQIGATPISTNDGRDVRLDQIAQVRVGIPNPPDTAAWLDGKDAVVLGAMVRPQQRIDSWTEAAEALIDEYRQTLPAGISIERILRQSDYVNNRLQSLTFNLMLGTIAVACVIWILMGWRAALIVTLTLPLASLMVLFGLNVFGIPIHQMSVTGLIIALGLLIDNAIVMVDEIQSRMRRGDSPVDAMSWGVAHLAVPLLGSTLTTAFAFAPIALMPGPAGEFVGAIAISVILAIFSSLFLSMTVIPTVAARQLAGGANLSRESPGLHLPKLTKFVEATLRQFVRRPVQGIAFSLVLPIAGFVAFTTLEEQFFPASGRDQIHITLDGPATDSLARTRATSEKVDTIARKAGAVRIDWFFGESAPQFYYNVISSRQGTPNYAQGLVKLPPGMEPEGLVKSLQRELSREITSSRVLVKQLEQGPPFGAPIEVRFFGPDLEVLRRFGDETRAILSRMPQVISVRTDLADVLPQISFDIDEASAAQAGISPKEIARQLSTSLEGQSGGSVLQDNEVVPIVVRVGDADRSELARIASFDLVLPAINAGESGLRVTPLSAFATVSLEPEPAALPRLNRMRMNEVAAYVEAGVLPSEVQRALEVGLADLIDRLPSGYTVSFGGEASKRDDAVGNLFSTVGVLAVLMLATLVLSFGSFRMAGIISAIAALSVGLGMGALALSGYPFGFMAIIGTMGLIGVAINDSIVVLAGIRANPIAARGDVDAIVGEVMHSSRHVVATTLTTMAGFTPLILDGGGFWPPMAVSIAGGVAGATLLALVLVPSLYRLLCMGRAAARSV